MIFVGHVGKQRVVLSCTTSWGLSELRHLYFVVLLHARVAGVRQLGGRSRLHCSGYSGCGLGGGPHWRRGLWGLTFHHEASSVCIGRVWPPLRSSWPGNLAGEAPGQQPGRGGLSVLLLCLLLLCFPETGIQPRGSGLGPPSALSLLSF